MSTIETLTAQVKPTYLVMALIEVTDYEGIDLALVNGVPQIVGVKATTLVNE